MAHSSTPAPPCEALSPKPAPPLFPLYKHTCTHPQPDLPRAPERASSSAGAGGEACLTNPLSLGFEDLGFQTCIAPRGIPWLSFSVNT